MKKSVLTTLVFCLGFGFAESNWSIDENSNFAFKNSTTDLRVVFVKDGPAGTNVLTQFYLSAPSLVNGESSAFCTAYYYSGIVGDSYALTMFNYSNKSNANTYGRIIEDLKSTSTFVKTQSSVTCDSLESPSNLRETIPIYIPISSSRFVVLGSLGNITVALN